MPVTGQWMQRLTKLFQPKPGRKTLAEMNRRERRAAWKQYREADHTSGNGAGKRTKPHNWKSKLARRRKLADASRKFNRRQK